LCPATCTFSDEISQQSLLKMNTMGAQGKGWFTQAGGGIIGGMM
jgi:hypothetical protein